MDARNAEGWTALHVQAVRGDVFTVRALAAGRDQAVLDLLTPGPDQKTALYLAAVCGHHEMVQALIEAGASVECRVAPRSWTPLLAAVACGHVQVVKALLGAGARTDQTRDNKDMGDGVTALMYACFPPANTNKGLVDMEIVKLLIEVGGADIDAVTSTGRTAIYFAVQKRCLPACQALLAAGASPACNANYFKGAALDGRTGLTPLMLSAQCEDGAAVMQALIDAGAQVDAADSEGHTALLRASEYGRVECVKVLLKAGADTEIAGSRYEMDLEDLTPLIVASYVGHHEVVSLLLAASADAKAMDSDAMSASAYAKTRGRGMCEALLRSHLAELKSKKRKRGKAKVKAEAGAAQGKAAGGGGGSGGSGSGGDENDDAGGNKGAGAGKGKGKGKGKSKSKGRAAKRARRAKVKTEKVESGPLDLDDLDDLDAIDSGGSGAAATGGKGE